MTATLVSIVTRLPAATVLALAALAKAIVYPRSADRLWVPAPGIAAVGGRRGLLGLAVVAEMGGALLLLVAPGAVVAPTVGALIVLLTGYGLASIAKAGTCGCWGGVSLRSTSRRTLVARNLVLLGMVVGSYPTEGLADMAVLASVAPLLGYLPLLALLLMATAGATGARPVRRSM